MPINVSVIYSVTDRKRFSFGFKNLNLTTCGIYEITTEGNDPGRFKNKKEEGIQANANKKKAGITSFVIDKAFFVLFLKC